MIAGLTAAEIAKVAFEAVIGKLAEGVLPLGKQLWDKIKNKLKREPTVEFFSKPVPKSRGHK